MSSRRQSLPVPAPAHPALGALLLALVLAVAGCGGASHQGPPPATPTSPPPASAPAARPGEQLSKDKEQASASRPATSGAGVITRREMKQVLEAGPQAFIQRVQVRPSFREGRFFGWRVVAYSGPGPVRAGDIVRRVNGRSLERPEQFMEAWNGLSRRSELTVDMVRSGRRLVLRWSIVE